MIALPHPATQLLAFGPSGILIRLLNVADAMSEFTSIARY